jgi:hypothetical protein
MSNAKPTKQVENPKIKTDKDFREMFLPQTPEENAILEVDILESGCHTPLVVWKEQGILVAGYHRYDIFKKHKRKYKIRPISFNSREEVKLWMWSNQAGRRNSTTPFQRIEVALRIKDTITARVKDRQKEGGQKLCLKSDKPIHTYKLLGEMTGASHGTVRNAETILRQFNEGIISEDEINALRTGKAKINRIYNQYKKPKSATTPNGKNTASEQQDNALTTSIPVGWKRMTNDKRHTFARNTLDNMIEHMPETDRQQFANMVLEWVNAQQTDFTPP